MSKANIEGESPAVHRRCYRPTLENLKAEHCAWQADECHWALRIESAEAIARAFPEIVTALEESVKLQSHYAELLNMHDGGERIGFASADAWIDRLRECGKLAR